MSDDQNVVAVPMDGREDDATEAPVQYELWRETIQTERQRIETRNRQVDVMRETISMMGAADERQFKYRTDRLGRDGEYRKGRFRFLSRVGLDGLGHCGSDRQRRPLHDLLGYRCPAG